MAGLISPVATRRRCGLAVVMAIASPTALRIFVGTYTPKEGSSRGIYSLNLDQATGALSEPQLAAEANNPTFLALTPDGHTLLAPDGQGAVSAFRPDFSTGSLHKLHTEPATSAGLTHLGNDANGRMLVSVSYSAGQIAVHPLSKGLPGARTDLHEPTGVLGPVLKRQDKPHPHSVTFSPDSRHVYICDLGLDAILSFRIDANNCRLQPLASFACAPGAGPRHAKFSHDGRFLYVMNELNSTLDIWAADQTTGLLQHVQTASTLPENYAGENITAEVRISADERFLYASNRGHDSIAVFSRDAAAGTVRLRQVVACGGQHPRNFSLSLDGQWLVCANRDTNNLVSFRVNPSTGLLTPTGQQAMVFQPVCVLFAT